jgi:hypothetical protein
MTEASPSGTLTTSTTKEGHMALPGSSSSPSVASLHLTFSGHIAVEFLVGVALGAAPFIFGFDSGATIVSVALGVATATIAISTRAGGRAISAHQAWDRALVSILFVTSVVSALMDIGADTAVFAAATVIEAGLAMITRYVAE